VRVVEVESCSWLLVDEGGWDIQQLVEHRIAERDVRAGMEDLTLPTLVFEDRSRLEGSSWNLSSLAVHYFRIVASCLVVEIDWDCQRLDHSAASSACHHDSSLQDSRRDRSLRMTWDRVRTFGSQWLARI